PPRWGAAAAFCAMSTLGIDLYLIAHNTPARETLLRTRRIARQNYAQCFEAGPENGGVFPEKPAPPALIGPPFRRFSHGRGWDPRLCSGWSQWRAPARR